MCPICGQPHYACKGTAGEPMAIVALPKRQGQDKMAEHKDDYIATETLYLDKNGKVVGAKDPARAEKLIHQGCRLPAALAQRYGLTNAPASGNSVAEPKSTPTQQQSNIPKTEPQAAQALSVGTPPKPEAAPQTASVEGEKTEEKAKTGGKLKADGKVKTGAP